MIGRQFEHQWCTSQVLFPIGKLVIQELASHLFMLPEGIVSILKRQIKQWGRLSLDMGAIERTQFAEQHSKRPHIKHNVMDRYEKPILGRTWCKIT